MAGAGCPVKAAGISAGKSCFRGRVIAVVVVGIAAFGLAYYFATSGDPCKSKHCRAKSSRKQRRTKKASSKSQAATSSASGTSTDGTSSVAAAPSTSGSSVATGAEPEKPQESSGPGPEKQ